MRNKIVLNQFGDLSERRTLQKLKKGTEGPRRLSASPHFTISIKATPVVLNFDGFALGRGPSKAIRDHLQQRIEGITQKAAPSTLAARSRAARGAYSPRADKSKIDSNRRYQPTKNSATPPNQTDRLFNDSGRFAKGLAVAFTENKSSIASREFTINVPRIRLDPTTLGGGVAALEKIYNKLTDLVPEFKNPALLRDVLGVRREIKKATEEIEPRIKRNNARGLWADLQKAKRSIEFIREIGAAVYL